MDRVQPTHPSGPLNDLARARQAPARPLPPAKPAALDYEELQLRRAARVNQLRQRWYRLVGTRAGRLALAACAVSLLLAWWLMS